MPEDKNKFLYEYAREAFDQEVGRYKRLDDKASLFISLLTALIVSFSAFIRFGLTEEFPPKNFFDWVILSVVALTFYALLSAWSQIFRSIKLLKSPRLPMDDNLKKVFKENDLDTCYKALTNSCQQGIKEARKLISTKTNHIEKGYDDIVCSVFLLSLSMLLLAVDKCI